jgi:hypothetical protein
MKRCSRIDLEPLDLSVWAYGEVTRRSRCDGGACWLADTAKRPCPGGDLDPYSSAGLEHA